MTYEEKLRQRYYQEIRQSMMDEQIEFIPEDFSEYDEDEYAKSLLYNYQEKVREAEANEHVYLTPEDFYKTTV